MIIWLAAAAAVDFTPETIVWPIEPASSIGISAHDGNIAVASRSPEGGYTVVDTRLGTTTSQVPPEGQHMHIPMLAHFPAPLGDLLVCGEDYATVVVCDTGASILTGDVAYLLADVDGDGFHDILGNFGVHIFDGTSWRSFPYPPTYDASHPRLLGDVDRDGRVDAWTLEYTESRFVGYFYAYDAMRMRIHRGTDEGFAPEPTWILDIDGIVVDALAVQMDDDPQRELLLAIIDCVDSLTSPIPWVGVATSDLDDSPIRVDHLPYGVHTFTPWPMPAWFPDALHPIGDVDGDGLEDALIVGELSGLYDRPASERYLLRIAGSSRGWRLDDPLVGLPFDMSYGEVDEAFTTTSDLDGDGRLDVISVRELEPLPYGTTMPYQTTVQVWYAPWLEPDPQPPHTGDTGDTGEPTPTARADTGSPTTAPESPTPSTSFADPEEGCGCGVGAMQAGTPLTRRRAGAR